jgi:hypothetical protein
MIRRSVLRAPVALLFVAACSSPHATSTGPTAAVDSARVTTASISATAPALSASAVATAPEPRGELDVDPSMFDFAAHPELAARIAETPHSYFRFIGTPFRRAVCKAFESDLPTLPKVRLHGDPHAEQYAVTDLGRWLMDYDDAAVGPSVIDLVRMATSLILATRQLGGTAADADAAIAALMKGYADGLDGKTPPTEPPAFAKPLVAKLSHDRKAFLEMVDKSMEVPLSKEAEAAARAELADYVALLAKSGTKRPASFFEVRRVGSQKLGIGSALMRRYLFRLEGPTKSPDDDVVVEVKEVSDLSGASCVTGITDGVVVERAAAQRRAKLDKTLLAPILLSDKKFWASEWLSNYFEVRVKKLSGASDLAALAHEAGEMLAIEHRKALPDGSLDSPKQGAPKQALELGAPLRDKISKVAFALADESESSWRRFKRDVAAPTEK